MFFNSLRESDLLSCWLWCRISFASSRFRRCSFHNSVLRNLYSLIEVVVSGHEPDNPGKAYLVVIRRFQTQSRMLAPDTSVYPYIANSTDVNSSWQLFTDCRRVGLVSLGLHCSLDIQLYSVHDSSSSSRSYFPRGSSDAVEQHTISRILFWNSAHASRKNNSVWRSNFSDLRFVFDSEENPLVPPRLDLNLSLGLLQIKYFFRPRHISTWHSRTTVGSAIAGHICSTVRSMQILHTMEVENVISQLSHRATHAQNISTCELSLSQF